MPLLLLCAATGFGIRGGTRVAQAGIASETDAGSPLWRFRCVALAEPRSPFLPILARCGLLAEKSLDRRYATRIMKARGAFS
jgi:hypothetical protein